MPEIRNEGIRKYIWKVVDMSRNDLIWLVVERYLWDGITHSNLARVLACNQNAASKSDEIDFNVEGTLRIRKL